MVNIQPELTRGVEAYLNGLIYRNARQFSTAPSAASSPVVKRLPSLVIAP
jgi:hypothetical protein